MRYILTGLLAGLMGCGSVVWPSPECMVVDRNEGKVIECACNPWTDEIVDWPGVAPQAGIVRHKCGEKYMPIVIMAKKVPR